MTHPVPKQTALFFGFLAAAMTAGSAEAGPASGSPIVPVEASRDVAAAGVVAHRVAEPMRDPESLETLRRLGLAAESYTSPPKLAQH